MRRRLPAGVKMYTGDDFNYPELIEGDARAIRHALLGIFDPLAPAAAQAVSLLGAGRRGRLPRDAGSDRSAGAADLPRADAILQDRRGLPGLAERFPGPFHHAERRAGDAAFALFHRMCSGWPMAAACCATRTWRWRG